jgi:hypothetical protein
MEEEKRQKEEVDANGKGGDENEESKIVILWNPADIRFSLGMLASIMQRYAKTL